jgi:hypothetical protein
MSLDDESMRILRELDEGTDWELSGDLLAANDPDDEEDGGSGVAVLPEHHSGPDGDSEGLAAAETVENILSCTHDMDEHGLVKDIVVLVNTKNDEQMLFTTLERNDLIMARLIVGLLNWHTSQIAMSNIEEGGDE